MSNSQLSVLIQRQAEKYGDRVALKYRDYDTETWVPVSWKQFAETVTTTSLSLIHISEPTRLSHKLGGPSALYAGGCGYPLPFCG